MHPGDHDHEHDDHDHHDGDGLPEGVLRAPHHLGGGYLYRAGQLLCDRRNAPAVRSLINRMGMETFGPDEPIRETGLVRMRVAEERISVPEIVTRLRGRDFHPEDGELPWSVHPHYVLCATTHPKAFPTAPPAAGTALVDLSGSITNPPGGGVKVAVIDSGMMDGHPFLGGRTRPLHAGVRDLEEPTFTGDGHLEQYAGHGTFIAGVVLQHAPGAEVVACKVFGGDGCFDDDQLATAIDALPDDIHVLNLSLGAYTHGDAGLPLTALALAGAFARNPGLVVVAAAGNDGLDRQTFPAAFKRVVGVGALGLDGRRACFSNFGPWVDAWAFGVDVASAFFEVDAEPQPVPGPHCLGEPAKGVQQYQGWASWSGTSFAAPKVAGAIAAAVGPALDACEAAFRLVGAAQAPRMKDPGCGWGALVDPACYA
jgi:subtilisin family serine protease